MKEIDPYTVLSFSLQLLVEEQGGSWFIPGPVGEGGSRCLLDTDEVTLKDHTLPAQLSLPIGLRTGPPPFSTNRQHLLRCQPQDLPSPQASWRNSPSDYQTLSTWLLKPTVLP